MNKIKIIALFGESSAGKDTIQHWLKNEYNMHSIVSYTTRPPRDYEKNGKEYYFITKEQFKQLIADKKMLEYSIFNWWYYGTCITELREDKINIGVFNPEGIRKLLKLSDTINVLPVWIKTNDKIRMYRSLNREKNPDCEEICRRFLTDLEDFSHIDFEYEIYLNDSDRDTYYGFVNRPKINTFLKL